MKKEVKKITSLLQKTSNDPNTLITLNDPLLVFDSTKDAKDFKEATLKQQKINRQIEKNLPKIFIV